MTAMLALEQARSAWERSQPQLQFFYGLVNGPTVTHHGATEPGEHGAVGSLTSLRTGIRAGLLSPFRPADTRLAQTSVSSPSEDHQTGGAGTYREVSASTARQEEL